MRAPGPIGGPVRPAIAAAALLLGQQVAARATRDAFFLSVFDVSVLPAMAAVAAAVSLAVTIVASRALARLSPARLLPAALAVSAVAFLGEWGLALTWPRPAAVVLYLHHAVLGAILVSGFWSLVTEQFNPHAAKHAMGPIGAGASLGGVMGGLVTWAAATRLAPPAMLLLLCGISAAALITTRQLARNPPARAAADPAPAPALAGRPAVEIIRHVPYLMALALLVVLTAFLDAVLDYLLAAAATASFGTGAALMSFFALFHAATGLLGLAGQAGLVRLLLQRLGPAWTLAAPSVFAAAGAALAALVPRLASIVVLRGGHGVLRNSAFRSGYELLYTPLPEHQKRPTKVLIDIAGERAGAIAGSLAVALILLAAPGGASWILPALAAAAALGAVALTPMLRRGYVGALASSLRSGAASLDTPDIVDPATLLTLASLSAAPVRARDTPATPGPEAAWRDPVLAAITDLRSEDPGRIAGVLSAGELDVRLVPHAIPLLARDGLFEPVSASLRAAAPRCTGQLVDALLDAQLEPVVRRRVARVLKGVPTQRAADGLLLGLGEPRFDLRYRSAQALLRVRAHNPSIAIPTDRILDIVAHEAAHAGDSPRHLEHCFTLLGIVLERGPLDSAYRALQSSDAGLRGTALEYLENVLPGPVRERLWPHLGGAVRPVPSGRSTAQMRDELLRSTMSMRVSHRSSR
jgi:hypothetical protein